MSKKIIIAHTKGGVGKSTLAWNLAHSLHAAGEVVRIVDLDFQQTLFFINALNEKPIIEVLQPQTADELLNIIEENHGYLIIDVGGFDSDINRIALSRADKILVPISPSITEVIGFKTFEAIIEDINATSINMVLNNIHPLQKDFTEIEKVVNESGAKLLKTIIRQRKTDINDIINFIPIFPGEIVVARKEAMNIFNTKIDDMALGIVAGLPKFTKQEKLEHYCKKLQMVWDGELCLQ